MHKPAFSEEVLYALKEVHLLRPTLVSQEELSHFDKEAFHKIDAGMRIKHASNIGMSRSVHQQAAILFYELCKQPGKTKTVRRNAIIALLLFLFKHQYWLSFDPQRFSSLIRWIELSPAEATRETILGTSKVLRGHMVSR